MQCQCLLLNNNNKDKRKMCSKCRLEKCFRLGMKKETIDSKVILKDLFRQLSIEDWLQLENLQSSFVFYCPHSNNEQQQHINWITWSNSASDNAISFINYFQHIQQFQQINQDDQFILIKFNLFSIFLSSKGYYYEFNAKSSSSRQLFEHDPSKSFERCEKLTKELVELTQRDSRIVSLVSTILMFSPGISMNENEPSLKDPINVCRIQNHFIKILINYLIDKFDVNEAQNYFVRLFFLILRIQFTTRDLKKLFQFHFLNKSQRIPPLMETILNLC